MKRGFTLIEMIFVIIVSSIIGYYIIASNNQKNFYEDVSILEKDIGNIVNNGIMDTVKGYVNGTGGDCSNSTNYIDISAGRVIDCIGWGTVYPYKGIKDNDGTKSYIYNLLLRHSKDDGCHLYIDNQGLNSDEFYIYIDCSNVNFNDNEDNRFSSYIEDKLSNYFKTYFSTIVQRIDRSATAVNNGNGGTLDDGKLRILMKK